MNGKNTLIFLLSIVFLVGIVWLHRSIEFIWLTPEQKLNSLVAQDLELLRSQEKLPKSWASIRAIEMSKNEDLSEYWLKSFELPISINPQGDHQLEILVLPWIKEGDYGVAINYHLINSRGVTETEFGRTFIVGKESEISERLLEASSSGKEKAPQGAAK